MRCFTILLFLFLMVHLQSQIAVNMDGSLPDPNAILHVKGSNNNHFFIDMNTGKTGINNISPRYTLDVNGSTFTDTLCLTGHNTAMGMMTIKESIRIGYDQSTTLGSIYIGGGQFGKTVFDLSNDNYNIGIGNDIFHDLTTGYDNIVIGLYTGYNITTGFSNIFIGQSAGEHQSTGNNNICIGQKSGDSNQGMYNVFLGFKAGLSNSGGSASNNFITGENAAWGLENGSNNVYIGELAGSYNENGDHNIMVGVQTGRENDGSHNIFLGEGVGKYYSGSDKLFIDKSYRENHDYLISGDFEKRKVTINDVLRLKPLVASPSDPQKGDLYMNGTDNHLYLYNGSNWIQLDN